MKKITPEQLFEMKDEIIDLLEDVGREDSYCGDWAREILKKLEAEEKQV